MFRTILVDDERPALQVLARLLKGYPEVDLVGEYTSFSDALTSIKRNDIHLVFLDIDLPGLNGLEASKIIKRHNQDIAIVFVTAYDQFALTAFELNAVDYLMKPVTKKRLDITINRLIKKNASLDVHEFYHIQANFLNDLIAGKTFTADILMQYSKLLNIDLDRPFSFYLIAIEDLPADTDPKTPIEAIVDKLSREADLVVWRTAHGVGVIDYAPVPDGHVEEESARASRWRESIVSLHPGLSVTVGIAERRAGAAGLADRYRQAGKAAAVGRKVSPASGVYHFCGNEILPILDAADRKTAASLVDRTIGRIIEYDRANNTQLFATLERIILRGNLQMVAREMYLHYKTILFRKRSIENLLGISLNSFEGRTLVGLALLLYYIG